MMSSWFLMIMNSSVLLLAMAAGGVKLRFTMRFGCLKECRIQMNFVMRPKDKTRCCSHQIDLLWVLIFNSQSSDLHTVYDYGFITSLSSGEPKIVVIVTAVFNESDNRVFVRSSHK